ncbi:MAG: 6-pyruvoyl tetrahydropterin synthase, partial [Synechococcus sp. TMED90]
MTDAITTAPHGQGRGCVIPRRACFSSSHRYWLPELSADDNAARFGSCAMAPGHGHNYELIVSMAGGLDANGMVLNLSEVKHAIRSEITEQLDFRFLNEAWPEFDVTSSEGCLPTTEALVRIIWSRLANQLPLVALRLYESSGLWADYLGQTMDAFLTIRTHFAAAHRLARPELSQEENERIYG